MPARGGRASYGFTVSGGFPSRTGKCNRSPEKPAKGEGTFAGHTPLSDRPPGNDFTPFCPGETETYEEFPATSLAENLHRLEFRLTPYPNFTQLHTQAFQSSTGQVHFRSFSVQAW